MCFLENSKENARVEMAQGSIVGQGLEAVALLEKDLAGDILVSW